MNLSAFVIHSRRTGLGIIRSLGKKGIKVYTADTYKAEGFYSRYTTKGFVIPELILVGNDVLVQKFVELASYIDPENTKPYLYTGSDDYLMFFVKNWKTLSKYYRSTFETDLHILKSCLEKYKMYKIAELAGVAIPKTLYSPSSASEVKSFPVIIKPSLKKTDKIDVIKSAFRIKKAKSPQELDKYIGILTSLGVKYVVQEYIEGEDATLYTAGIYAHNGELVAAGTGRKIRQYPPGLGECSLGELVAEPELIKYAGDLVRQANITGICQIEFKKWNDRFYLIEINPRPWSWISLMDYAGLNLPYIAIQSHEGVKLESPILQKRNKGSWMFPVMDFKYNFLIHKNTSFFGFFRDVLVSKRLAFFKLTDPLPIFIHVYFAFFYEYINPYLKRRKSK